MWDLRIEQVIEKLKKGKRIDGRKLDEYRPLEIKAAFSQNADGSAWVKLGATEVVCGVKFGLGEPYPDSPDEGALSVNAELLPIASPVFEVGPPNEDATELARVVDRGIREAKAIDFKKLCIEEGEKVWIVFIDIYAINDDGNLFDASSIAALTALLNARIPKLEDGEIVKKEYSGKLKLGKLPLLTTFAKISNFILLDPCLAEEKSKEGRFSVATTEDKKITAMQKGEVGAFKLKELENCIDLAFEKSAAVRKTIKESIGED
ncbi:MAG: exosome complex protein Rrp42 [Candidatus Diapherotrites archaeon]|nr:exosome complex protein Rrp42 [Candidatus Diapherotrites archaeon]